MEKVNTSVTALRKPIAGQEILNMLPGPTWVPSSIMSAMLDSNVYHRSDEFHRLFHEIEENLQYVFRTTRAVYTLSSSGTGGLESVVTNVLRPGDKTLVIVNGYFSQELSSIVEAFQRTPVRLDVPWDNSISLDNVEKALKEEPGIKAVGVAYVETSTGARAPLRELATLCERYDKLIFTDAESAVGGEEFLMDDWNIGASVAGTQKCICSPPGLALVCLGRRGAEAMEKNGRTGFYFDLQRYIESAKKDETPFTPALPQLFALRASLNLIREEGLENYVARQKKCGAMLRDGVANLGLKLYVPAESASNVATVVDITGTGLLASEIVKKMRENHGITIAGGLGPIKEKVIRIGTMGIVKPEDVSLTLESLNDVVRS